MSAPGLEPQVLPVQGTPCESHSWQDTYRLLLVHPAHAMIRGSPKRHPSIQELMEFLGMTPVTQIGLSSKFQAGWGGRLIPDLQFETLRANPRRLVCHARSKRCCLRCMVGFEAFAVFTSTSAARAQETLATAWRPPAGIL